MQIFKEGVACLPDILELLPLTQASRMAIGDWSVIEVYSRLNEIDSRE